MEYQGRVLPIYCCRQGQSKAQSWHYSRGDAPRVLMGAGFPALGPCRHWRGSLILFLFHRLVNEPQYPPFPVNRADDEFHAPLTIHDLRLSALPESG